MPRKAALNIQWSLNSGSKIGAVALPIVNVKISAAQSKRSALVTLNTL